MMRIINIIVFCLLSGFAFSQDVRLSVIEPCTVDGTPVRFGGVPVKGCVLVTDANGKQQYGRDTSILQGDQLIRWVISQINPTDTLLADTVDFSALSTPNWANGDLTLTGDRSHTLGAFDMTLNGTGGYFIMTTTLYGGGTTFTTEYTDIQMDATGQLQLNSPIYRLQTAPSADNAATELISRDPGTGFLHTRTTASLPNIGNTNLSTGGGVRSLNTGSGDFRLIGSSGTMFFDATDGIFRIEESSAGIELQSSTDDTYLYLEARSDEQNEIIFNKTTVSGFADNQWVVGQRIAGSQNFFIAGGDILAGGDPGGDAGPVTRMEMDLYTDITTFYFDVVVPAEVYGIGWNGSDEVPTKNDLYDKIETLGGGGVTDHGALTGLSDDDHPQYILADGMRAFSGSVDMGGFDITNINPEVYGVAWNGSNEAATKNDIYDQIESLGGGGVTDHGALTGLGDDDHTQYILVDGTRAFTGDVDFGHFDASNIDVLDFNNGTYITADAGDNFEVFTNNVSRLYISKTGFTGVNTTASTEKFGVNGKIVASTALQVGGGGLGTEIGTIQNTAGDLAITGSSNRDVRIGSSSFTDALYINGPSGEMRVGSQTDQGAYNFQVTGNAIIDVLDVDDEAYGIGWDASLEVPTKNALYDKIESLGGGGPVLASAVTVDNTNFDVLSGTDAQTVFEETDEALLQARSTGISYGWDLSVNGGDPTLVDISVGSGQILDNTVPTAPVYTSVSYPGATGVAIANTGVISTWWYIDAAGVLQQTITPPTRAEFRTRIYIGHTAFTGGVISGIDDLGQTVQQYGPNLHDLFSFLGLMHDGSIVSAASTDLTLAVSAGEIYDQGANRGTSAIDPNVLMFAAASPITFRHATINGPIVSDVTILDVGNYDLAGVVTAIPGSSSRASIFTVRRFPSGNIRIQYDQQWYNNMTDAELDLATRTFTPHTTDGIVVGYIIAEKGATDLSDPGEAVFIATNKFGGIAGGTVASAAVITDHGLLGGLTDDDHPQYILADGTRSFTGPVTLENGAESAVLTTSGGGSLGIVMSGNQFSGNVDTDLNSIFGRIRFGSPITDYAAFSHIDMLGTANVALLQNPSGATFLNSASGQNLNFRIGGTNSAVLNSSGEFITGGVGDNGVYPFQVNGDAYIGGSAEVDDEAYGVAWNGSLEVPTKNAVYDQIESIVAGGSNFATNDLTLTANRDHDLAGNSLAFTDANVDFEFFENFGNAIFVISASLTDDAVIEFQASGVKQAGLLFDNGGSVLTFEDGSGIDLWRTVVSTAETTFLGDVRVDPFSANAHLFVDGPTGGDAHLTYALNGTDLWTQGINGGTNTNYRIFNESLSSTAWSVSLADNTTTFAADISFSGSAVISTEAIDLVLDPTGGSSAVVIPNDVLEVQSDLIWINTNNSTDYAAVLRFAGEGTIDNYQGGYWQYDASGNQVVFGTHNTNDALNASDVEVLIVPRAGDAFNIIPNTEIDANLIVGSGQATSDAIIGIGDDRTFDGIAGIDFTASNSGNKQAWLYRDASNDGDFQLFNTGAGDIDINNSTGGNVILSTNSIDRMVVDFAGVTTFTSDAIVPDEAFGPSWNGSLEVPTKNAVSSVIAPSTPGAVSGGILATIALYGIAPVHSVGGTVTASNTASAATLHQYYVQSSGGRTYYFGAQILTVSASFSYVVGQTYYLQDGGTLGTSADADFDSAVLYVIADLGAGEYLINLADPRHFLP